MKRSGAVTLIMDTYAKNTPGDEFMTELMANEILTALEKAGLKPPEVWFNGNHKGCLCTMHESCPSCGGWCNEWEPENV